MHYLNVFSKEYFSSDENLTSDDESNTETSDEESIAGNASNMLNKICPHKTKQ